MTDPDYICGETTEIKDWTQIKVTVKLEDLDTAMAVMSVLDNNLNFGSNPIILESLANKRYCHIIILICRQKE